MNGRLLEPRRDPKGSAIASVAIHVVAIALIASITFRYPIASLFDSRNAPKQVDIQYVQVRPAQPVGNGSETTKKPPKKAKAPAPLVAPATVPTTLPPVPPPSVTAGAISGVAGGTGGAPAGIATGVEPALPDPRIELRPNTLHLPLSMAQRNDSAVQAIYAAYRDAELAAEAHAGRNPRDWTFEKGGGKYGMDSSYIYLGKFKIPSAILAALPLNHGGVEGSRIIENRNADWIRNDIYSHAQGLSEEDFRAAIKRIRERKDREKRQAEEDKQKPIPVVP
jgi:hypothetical protein